MNFGIITIMLMVLAMHIVQFFKRDIQTEKLMFVVLVKKVFLLYQHFTPQQKDFLTGQKSTIFQK